MLYHIILGKAAFASKAILAKSGKAGAILRDVQALASKQTASGNKLTSRDIQQKGPQLVRKSAEVAKNALAAVANVRD